jgi:hypothetical protein
MEGANYLARECAMDYGGHWRDFADSERGGLWLS